MYNNLDKRKIPLILLNARITERSFNRWKYFPTFSKNILEKIKVALPQNTETKKYLKSVNKLLIVIAVVGSILVLFL